ncbi:MAG TPA: zinc ribbon domain-containing protein [Blastocatellia bacterium]|nr:zinc ribbon domain-containing protein [Blastocatellia bacterium]
MYCPKCATTNSDDTKFCRGCGANLSLVPMALSGQLPEAPEDDRPGRHRRHTRRDRSDESQFARGITSAAMGTAFLLVAIGLWVSKQWWGLWMLIPAFAMLGRGIAAIASAKYARVATTAPRQISVNRAPNTGELQPPRTLSQIAPPPSVTEETTRHLDAPARRSDQVQ